MSNCYIKFIKSINITPIKIIAVIKVNFLIKSIINPFFNYSYNVTFYLPYVKLSQVSFVFLFLFITTFTFCGKNTTDNFRPKKSPEINQGLILVCIKV